MCGIVGFYTNSISNIGLLQKKQALSELVIANSFRGYDSTGFFAVDTEDDVHSHKSIVPGWEFLDFKKTRSVISDLGDFRSVVFHNRAATVGGVHVKNAHPFEFDKVVGVHNGTLWGYGNLCKGSYPVDSQALFAGINENGAVATIKKADGGIAMMFYDKERRKLCVYRNGERPLAYAKLKDDPTFFYASELDMLKWIITRNKLDIETIAEIPENTLIEVNIEDYEKIEMTSVKFERPTNFYPANNIQRRWDAEEEAWNNIPFSTNKQAGFVPLEDRSKLHEPRKDSAGYSVGSKVLVELVEVRSGAGGKYEAEGALVGYDYCRVQINGISPQDYKIMTPFMQKNNGLLLYANIMGIYNTDNYKLKWILASPYKPIPSYATKKTQDKMIESFDSSKAGTKKTEIVIPSPEEVLQLTGPKVEVREVPKLLLTPPKISDETMNADHGIKVRGPGGNYMSLQEFTEATKAGCAVCGQHVFKGDDIDWDMFPQPSHAKCCRQWDIEQNNIRKDKIRRLN